MVHFSGILMVLKDRRFKSCERIYAIDFSMLPRKLISHYGFGFFIFSVSFSIGSILFYQNQPNLSKVMLF